MQLETQVSDRLCKLNIILNKNIYDFESLPHPHNVNRVLAANSSSVPVEASFHPKEEVSLTNSNRPYMCIRPIQFEHFFNFQNCQTVLCDISIDEQMLEKSFCLNITPIPHICQF